MVMIILFLGVIGILYDWVDELLLFVVEEIFFVRLLEDEEIVKVKEFLGFVWLDEVGNMVNWLCVVKLYDVEVRGKIILLL